MNQTSIFREERGVSPCLLDGRERAIFIKWIDEKKARVYRPRNINEFKEDNFFEVENDRIELLDFWKVSFFDTETTGLPKSYSAPVTDVENWPRMVELAFSSTEIHFKTGEKREEAIFDLIIEPEGYKIPEEAAKIHGISQEQAEIEGLPVVYALEKFVKCLNGCDFLSAHNVAFDEKIVGAEIIRHRKQAPKFPTLPKLCSMRLFQKKKGGVNMSLTNLHKLLFKRGFEGAHRADVDVLALSNCFEALVKNKTINPQKEIEDFLKTQKGF